MYLLLELPFQTAMASRGADVSYGAIRVGAVIPNRTVPQRGNLFLSRTEPHRRLLKGKLFTPPHLTERLSKGTPAPEWHRSALAKRGTLRMP